MERNSVRTLSIHFLVVAVCLCVSAGVAGAQEHQHPAPDQDGAASDTKWTWTTDANAFFGYNYQQRKYADFAAWESQNWVMLDASRRIGRGRLTIDVMGSFEPWTIGRLVYAGRDSEGRLIRLPPTADRRSSIRRAKAISRSRSSTSSIRTI